MTAPNLSERWRIWRLGPKRGHPPAKGRTVSRPLFGWSRSAAAPVSQFLLVPSDLRSGDPDFLLEYRKGQLCFGGEIVRFDRQSPFAIDGGSAAWQRDLHGFGWLRDLAAAATPDALQAARALVADWLARNRRPRGRAWQADVLARRVISWNAHSGFLLEGAEPDFFRAVTDSLGLHLRVLTATHQTARPGLPHLTCLLAMLLADLTIEGRDDARAVSEKLVLNELSLQILTDGGHLSRNSSTVLEVLYDLLPLRRCYAARALEVPPVLAQSVSRMLTYLRTMRLGDGTLARFNGVGPSRPDAMATILSFDTDETPLPTELPASGYIRIERGATVLIMNCASAPPLEYSGAADAGFLSLEMTDGRDPLLVNAGYPGAGRLIDAPAARATASQTTLCLNGQSSARFISSPAITRICGDAALGGPPNVTLRFMQVQGECAVEASHDGYLQSHQMIHSRRLELSSDGQKLEGRDRLGPRHGVLRLGRDLPFAIHFHLARGVAADIESGRTSVALRLATGQAWRLVVDGAIPHIEMSQRFDRAQSDTTARQIVLRGDCSGETVVQWTLERVNN